MVLNLDHKVNDISSEPESHSLQEEDRGEGSWIKTWFSWRTCVNYCSEFAGCLTKQAHPIP